MAQTDTLIIGQGLSGTWLSYWLEKAGMDYLVIDENSPVSASRIASGVINPVTGRALAETWMADFLMNFCLEAYSDIGQLMGIDCVESIEILHSFPTEQMRHSFEKRLPDLGHYLKYPGKNNWDEYFHLPYGVGIIHPALLVNLQLLLEKWQAYLVKKDALVNEHFEIAELKLHDKGISYKNINASRIIFCDGVNSLNYSFFGKLPFAPNKGEALLVRVPGLSQQYIYKKGISIVPFPQLNRQEEYFWVGSTYDNQFKDDQPTEAFRLRTIQQLSNWLKLPFSVEAHWAAIRPANIERRPFVGMHPFQPQVGILNGMGTKGCSLAPWMAKQLADNLSGGTKIDAEAGLERFSRILAV